MSTLAMEFDHLTFTLSRVNLDGDDNYDRLREAKSAFGATSLARALFVAGVEITLDTESTLIVESLGLRAEADVAPATLLASAQDESLSKDARLIHAVLAWNRHLLLHDDYPVCVTDRRERPSWYEPKAKDLDVFFTCVHLIEDYLGSDRSDEFRTHWSSWGLAEHFFWILMHEDDEARQRAKGVEGFFDTRTQDYFAYALADSLNAAGDDADAVDVHGLTSALLEQANSSSDLLGYLRTPRGVDDRDAAAVRRSG